jgi:hypothetical protein
VAQRPGTLKPGRILVDAIEDAGLAQMPVSRGKTAVDLLDAEPGE